jgi:hypothetical protein
MMTATIRTMRVNGPPTRTKSPNRWFPGETTSVFTGEDAGVVYAVLAPSITIKGQLLAPPASGGWLARKE